MPNRAIEGEYRGVFDSALPTSKDGEMLGRSPSESLLISVIKLGNIP